METQDSKPVRMGHEEIVEEDMKKLLVLFLLILMAGGCTPVIRTDLMDRGSRDIPFDAMAKAPTSFTGKTYILGGVIADTKPVDKGLIIDCFYVPVDGRGYLTGQQSYSQRFLALYPKVRGDLDTTLYKTDRTITVAGLFRGIAKGKVGEVTYEDPLFEIEEIYLWPQDHWPSPPKPYSTPVHRYNFLDRILGDPNPW